MIATFSRNETRFSTRSAGPLRPYRPFADMTSSMSAPSAELQCLQLGGATGVEWIIESANGVTAYTVHYGRWVKTPENTVAGDAVSAWMEVGTVAVTGATDGELFRLTQETFGDAVGIYVNTYTGAAGEPFRFWARETG